MHWPIIRWVSPTIRISARIKIRRESNDQVISVMMAESEAELDDGWKSLLWSWCDKCWSPGDPVSLVTSPGNNNVSWRRCEGIITLSCVLPAQWARRLSQDFLRPGLRSGGKVVVSSTQWGVWTWYGAALSFLDRNLAYAELFVSALCEYCERGAHSMDQSARLLRCPVAGRESKAKTKLNKFESNIDESILYFFNWNNEMLGGGWVGGCWKVSFETWVGVLAESGA